jgi:hypothetical protein
MSARRRTLSAATSMWPVRAHGRRWAARTSFIDSVISGAAMSARTHTSYVARSLAAWRVALSPAWSIFAWPVDALARERSRARRGECSNGIP